MWKIVYSALARPVLPVDFSAVSLPRLWRKNSPQAALDRPDCVAPLAIANYTFVRLGLSSQYIWPAFGAAAVVSVLLYIPFVAYEERGELLDP